MSKKLRAKLEDEFLPPKATNVGRVGSHGFMVGPLDWVLVHGLTHATTLVEFGGETINEIYFLLL